MAVTFEEACVLAGEEAGPLDEFDGHKCGWVVMNFGWDGGHCWLPAIDWVDDFGGSMLPLGPGGWVVDKETGEVHQVGSLIWMTLTFDGTKVGVFPDGWDE